MEHFHDESPDHVLDAQLGNDGIIYLKLSGNLSEDTLPSIQAWNDAIRTAMHEASDRDPQHVLTLIDASGMIEVDTKGIEALYEIMHHNKSYATRTAVYGAHYFSTLIIEMALHVTKRDNMRLFKTREEGMAWLLEDGAPVPLGSGARS
jgi:ABC-type transporter Mla MlaB component